MAPVLGYIPDGYTEPFTIIGIPGLYPTVSGTMRPMLQEELVAYYKAIEKASPWQVRQMVAKLLADHLVTWDVKDDKDQTVPIKPAPILRLKDKLFSRLFGVVSTQEPADLQPESTSDELDAAAADLLKAATTEQPVSQVREERERKN